MPAALQSVAEATLGDIVYIVGALGAMIGLATAIIVPFRKMITKYQTALEAAQDMLHEQKHINEMQSKLIEESRRDRGILHDETKQIQKNIDEIRIGVRAILQPELAKLSQQILAKGSATIAESRYLNTLWEGYAKTGGNGADAGLYNAASMCPVKPSKQECDRREREEE